MGERALVLRSQASISRMSTTSRSPGSAPSTRNGPLSTCTPGSGRWDVVRRVVVLDRAVEPLTAVGAEDVARLDVTFGGSGASGCADVFLVGELLRLSAVKDFVDTQLPRSITRQARRRPTRRGGRAFAEVSSGVVMSAISTGSSLSEAPLSSTNASVPSRTAASGRAGPRDEQRGNRPEQERRDTAQATASRPDLS